MAGVTRDALATISDYWSLAPFLPASLRPSGIGLSSNQRPLSLPMVVPGLCVSIARNQEEHYE